MTPQTIIFLGPQGSGKGTQSKLFKEYLAKSDPSRPVLEFSMGAALRSLVERDGYTASLAAPSMDRGELQPFFITAGLFASYLIEHMQQDVHYLVDGFPRAEDQVRIFDSAMRFYNRSTPTVLYVSISDEEALTRLLKRAREDDTEENIRRRLAWTHAEWGKIKKHFDEQAGYKVVEIQGEQTIEEVHHEILSKLGLS